MMDDELGECSDLEVYDGFPEPLADDTDLMKQVMTSHLGYK